MITTALLIVIGIKLEMEEWYFVLAGISLFLAILSSMIKIYKIGKENRLDD